MRYRLYREQQLQCTAQQAWDFFSSPYNLEKITPKEMGFNIRSKVAVDSIYEGMEIDYFVSPIWHIPLKWKTRIVQVNPKRSFTDFQEKGPYKYWNHYHEFIPNEKGILMKDTVDYELPFGILGIIAHRLFVKKKLKHIFQYRYEILEKKFNQQSC